MRPFAPHQKRRTWIYATCGLAVGAPHLLEIHVRSPSESWLHVELLTVIAHYHLTGALLDVGHTVDFGRPWWPRSSCDHGVLSLPYVDGPALEWMSRGDERVRCLWLIPITRAERDSR